MGGDDTTAIDAAAEDAVVARLEALDADFILVSEELGERAFGSGGPLRIVVDPIDGSVNAKRGIPFFSLSLAVAEGPAMGDVTFGFVHDFGAGEEWVAERGAGARLNGRPLDGPAAEGSDRDPLLRGDDDRLHRRAGSRRPWCRAAAARDGIPGAFSLPSRGGRVDAVCSLKAARSIDIAAAQLLVREQGYAIELFEDPPFAAAPLDLEGRSRVVAAATPELCLTLAEALRQR